MLYTPQEFAQAMAELAENRDVEDRHEAMDDLMCEVLDEQGFVADARELDIDLRCEILCAMGYEEGVDIYEEYG